MVVLVVRVSGMTMVLLRASVIVTVRVSVVMPFVVNAMVSKSKSNINSKIPRKIESCVMSRVKGKRKSTTVFPGPSGGHSDRQSRGREVGGVGRHC